MRPHCAQQPEYALPRPPEVSKLQTLPYPRHAAVAPMVAALEGSTVRLVLYSDVDVSASGVWI